MKKLMETLIPFLSLIVLMAVHLLGDKFAFSKKIWHSHFLSASGGITAAYVFVNFLPKLCSSGQVLSQQDNSLLFLAEKHVFVLALLGFLFYYGIDFVEKQHDRPTKLAFQISLAGYLFFNFLMGYALGDITDPEVKPYSLFTIALGLHFFVNDHELSQHFPNYFKGKSRIWLAAALFVGWAWGFIQELPKEVVALYIAFISGSILMNVARHQLPRTDKQALAYFAAASLIYTLLLI